MDLVTRGVISETGAMMQLKATRKLYDAVEPWNQTIWDLIPKTYKSLKRLADTSTKALDDFNRMIHVFDVCGTCNGCVYDGNLNNPQLNVFVITHNIFFRRTLNASTLVLIYL